MVPPMKFARSQRADRSNFQILSMRKSTSACWMPKPWSRRASGGLRLPRRRYSACAESLGGVESLIEHPGRMTHASVAGTALEVPGDLIRLSVGIETVEDLIADLDRALS